ncbi:hypothetical protein F5Y08DRAFT_313108 [Xylaria arbuscula]|nr:hypothetical protein F5Y08DRAFT_313108 [Xylaria arbuscula]
MYGSYHVLFPLTFRTRLRWLVKIPAYGTADKWDETAAACLESEAKTMQLLKRETTIPIPEVLDFSSTIENPLRCPYIILSYISGVSLYDVWYGDTHYDVDPKVTHARRTRALEGIASAMIQLGKFSFKQSGSLTFADDGSPSGTSWSRRVDYKSMDNNKSMLNKSSTDQPPVDTVYARHEALDDPKLYYTFMLDLHREEEEKAYQKGVVLLLRQLISWIPEPARTDSFVLAHPDLNLQNILVSMDGELQGIIDWEGVSAVPHSIGNTKLPLWLMREWFPGMYEDAGSRWFASYRQAYRMAIKRQQTDTDSADLCRISLIAGNLAEAADRPNDRYEVVPKVVGEILRRIELDDDLNIKAIVTMFAEDRVGEAVMNAL